MKSISYKTNISVNDINMLYNNTINNEELLVEFCLCSRKRPNMLYKMGEVDFDIIHTQHTPITNQICQMYPNIDKISTIHSEVIELENPVLNDTIKKYICIRPEIQDHIVKKFNINKIGRAHV